MWKTYDRIVIAGPPKSGKTTLSHQVNDRPVIHADDFVRMPWSEQPDAVIEAVAGKPRWCAEGIAAHRALARGLSPDVVVYLAEPKVPLGRGQLHLADQVAQWMRDYGGLIVFL